MEIEAQAKRRLADEYDAAQERGEVATQARHGGSVPAGNTAPATVADLGLTRKAVHEARQLRDAEAADPGVIRRTLDERLARGEEPTKAAVRVTPYPHGIGATVDLVRELCQRDPAMLVAFDRAIAQPVGSNQHTQPLDNVQGQVAPTGNSAQAGVRRMRKAAEAGDAAAAAALARVEAGEQSVHAARADHHAPLHDAGGTTGICARNADGAAPYGLAHTVRPPSNV